jgi:hypothetical protein
MRLAGMLYLVLRLSSSNGAGGARTLFAFATTISLASTSVADPFTFSDDALALIVYVPGSTNPRLARRIERGEVRGGQREDERLRFAGPQQLGFGERLQFAFGLFERLARRADVQLDDLPARHLPGILHGHGRRRLPREGRGAQLHVVVGEIRIRKPVAEFVGGLHSEGVEVAVADPQAFLVSDIIADGLTFFTKVAVRATATS